MSHCSLLMPYKAKPFKQPFSGAAQFRSRLLRQRLPARRCSLQGVRQHEAKPALSRGPAIGLIALLLVFGPSTLPSCDHCLAFEATNIKSRSQDAVDQVRAAGHFVRAYDGHIAVQRKSGDWMDVRVDPETPGTVLLRSGRGHVYFLQYEFKQIDLSDDEMVRDMFEDRLWEDNLERMGYVDEAGKLIDYISQDDFYDWWRWSSGTVEDVQNARRGKQT